MKQVILLINVISVIAVHISSCTIITTLTLKNDIIKSLTEAANMSRTDVQSCFDMENIKSIYLKRIYESMINDVDIPKIEASTFRVGCFFACITKKIIAHTHLTPQKLIEILESEVRENAWQIDRSDQLMDCISRSKY